MDKPALIAEWLASHAHGQPETLVAGLSGLQGSGKTTLARQVAERLEQNGLTMTVMSLDDYYLSRAERCALASSVHPLLTTRGPPGTHDLPALLSDLDKLTALKSPMLLRAFDKASDDVAPETSWRFISRQPDVILLEGWCVGVTPQTSAELQQPVNELERDEDPDGIWRRWVNDRLADGYQHLFCRLDLLTALIPPSFDVVARWRLQQENTTFAHLPHDSPGRMGPDGIAHFIRHYERLSRHALKTLTKTADCILELDENRELTSCRFRPV